MSVEIKENKMLFGGELKVTYDEILESAGVIDNDIVYISGSLVEGYVDRFAKGMGNLYSDIDVFIIREHIDYVKTNAVYTSDVNKIFFCDRLMLDIEVFDKDYVIALSETLSELEIKKDIRISNVLKEKLNKGNDYDFINSFLNRLLYSICIYGEESYLEIKNNMNFKKFLELRKYELINFIDNVYSDVTGNMLAREIDAALYSFRLILKKILEVALAEEEIFVDRDKWISLKFTNLVNQKNIYENIHSIYRNINRGDLLNDNTCLREMEYFLPLMQKELEKIVLGGLEI